MLPLAGKRVLLLDADGVLRRLPDGQTLEGLERLEAFLREPEFADVVIVAAGEWKLALRLGQIQRLFAPDIRDRIVDVTPSIESADQFRSHVEIYAWLDAHPEIATWVVLESGYFWHQFPALDCAIFVLAGEVVGSRDLETLARFFRKEGGPIATSQ